MRLYRSILIVTIIKSLQLSLQSNQRYDIPHKVKQPTTQKEGNAGQQTARNSSSLSVGARDSSEQMLSIEAHAGCKISQTLKDRNKAENAKALRKIKG